MQLKAAQHFRAQYIHASLVTCGHLCGHFVRTAWMDGGWVARGRVESLASSDATLHCTILCYATLRYDTLQSEGEERVLLYSRVYEPPLHKQHCTLLRSLHDTALYMRHGHRPANTNHCNSSLVTTAPASAIGPNRASGVGTIL